MIRIRTSRTIQGNLGAFVDSLVGACICHRKLIGSSVYGNNVFIDSCSTFVIYNTQPEGKCRTCVWRGKGSDSSIGPAKRDSRRTSNLLPIVSRNGSVGVRAPRAIKLDGGTPSD